MATLVNLKRFLKRPTNLDGTCYVPQCSKFFLEKSIKYLLKKRISKKVFIFYFWKVLKLNFAIKCGKYWICLRFKKENNLFLEKFTFLYSKIQNFPHLKPGICTQNKGQKKVFFSKNPGIKGKFLAAKKVKKIKRHAKSS